jgi:lipopolysaccharide export system protein LptA
MLRSFSIASVSFVLAGALWIGSGGAGNNAAQAQLMRGHDSSAPVDFSADRIEVQDRADRAIVSGNVHVTQGNLVLDAARMTIAYTNAGGVEIQRIDASGNVRVTRGQDRATGDVGIYDLNRRIITLLGNVHLYQGTNNLAGSRLVMDLNTGLSKVDGRATGSGNAGGGGRVTGTFTVPKRQENAPK